MSGLQNDISKASEALKVKSLELKLLEEPEQEQKAKVPAKGSWLDDLDELLGDSDWEEDAPEEGVTELRSNLPSDIQEGRNLESKLPPLEAPQQERKAKVSAREALLDYLEVDELLDDYGWGGGASALKGVLDECIGGSKWRGLPQADRERIADGLVFFMAKKFVFKPLTKLVLESLTAAVETGDRSTNYMLLLKESADLLPLFKLLIVGERWERERMDPFILKHLVGTPEGLSVLKDWMDAKGSPMPRADIREALAQELVLAAERFTLDSSSKS